MKNVYAFIVGIETYDQPQWNVPGPCANALAVAEWCVHVKVPPKNIFCVLQFMRIARRRLGAVDGSDESNSRP